MAAILKFDLTFPVTEKKKKKKKKNLAEVKDIQNKYHFFVHLGANRIHYDFISYSALSYFGRNTTSIAFKSNCYDLASMPLCIAFQKPFYT